MTENKLLKYAAASAACLVACTLLFTACKKNDGGFVVPVQTQAAGALPTEPALPSESPQGTAAPVTTETVPPSDGKMFYVSTGNDLAPYIRSMLDAQLLKLEPGAELVPASVSSAALAASYLYAYAEIHCYSDAGIFMSDFEAAEALSVMFGSASYSLESFASDVAGGFIAGITRDEEGGVFLFEEREVYPATVAYYGTEDMAFSAGNVFYYSYSDAFGEQTGHVEVTFNECTGNSFGFSVNTMKLVDAPAE